MRGGAGPPRRLGPFPRPPDVSPGRPRACSLGARPRSGKHGTVQAHLRLLARCLLLLSPSRG